MKSSSARDLEQFVTTFHNPEVAAMGAIGDILQDLPDAAARLRVMRWAFAKYGDEFKRPLPDAPPAVTPAPVTGPVLVVSASRPTLSVVPPAPVVPIERTLADDIEEQVAELNDLFPEPPDTSSDF